jgi:hypothetical protein
MSIYYWVHIEKSLYSTTSYNLISLSEETVTFKIFSLETQSKMIMKTWVCDVILLTLPA